MNVGGAPAAPTPTVTRAVVQARRSTDQPDEMTSHLPPGFFFFFSRHHDTLLSSLSFSFSLPTYTTSSTMNQYIAMRSVCEHRLFVDFYPDPRSYASAFTPPPLPSPPLVSQSSPGRARLRRSTSGAWSSSWLPSRTTSPSTSFSMMVVI